MNAKISPARFLLRSGAVVLSLLGLIILVQVILRISRRFSPSPMPVFMAKGLNSPLRRRVFGTPEQIVERSGVTPGMQVLEIGPGPGFYTVPLLSRVTQDGQSGHVTCVELQPGMVELLRERLADVPAHTVEIIQGDGRSLPLPANHFDLVFLVSVLGETENLPALFHECTRVIKPGGVLAVTEQLLDPDFRTLATVNKLAREAGLSHIKHVGLPWASYTACYSKLSRDAVSHNEKQGLSGSV